MKLADLLPMFAQRKRLPEKDMADLFVESSVNASHEDMLLFRVQLASLLDRSKRVDVYVTTVLVYASANHQYVRRVEEFTAECRARIRRAQ